LGAYKRKKKAIELGWIGKRERKGDEKEED
jgi:hypothetical protein